MRTLVGLLLLVSLCGSAWYFQERWTKGVRAEREQMLSAPTGLREREKSWGELVVGRPSGAIPVELPEIAPDPVPQPGAEYSDENDSYVDSSGEPYFDPMEPTVFEYVVPKGRVLSKICEDFYRSGRAPIPQRVAEYNGLKSPDELRAGSTLLLPDWDVLFPGEQRP